MANRELSNSLKIVQSISPDLYTTNNTTVAGAAVDVQGYDGVTAFFSINDWGDTTTGGWEVGVQHSDDSVTGWEDVPNSQVSHYVTGDHTVSGACATGVFVKVNAAAEDDAVYTTDYLGAKRYVRQKMAAEGNQSTGSDLEGGFILGYPSNAKTGANRASS